MVGFGIHNGAIAAHDQKLQLSMMRFSTMKVLRISGLLIVACLFSFVTARAVPNWVTQAVAQSKGMSFNKEATAVTLLQTSEVKISSTGKSSRKERSVTKVLRTLDQDGLACSDFTYAGREIKGLKGWRLEPEGTVHKLDKDNIVEIAPQSTAGYYDDQHVLVATFPEVNIGDVVAFEYTVKENLPLEGLYQGFVIEDDYPLVSARIEVELPEGWLFNSSAQNIETFTVTVEGKKHIWESGLIPFYPEEPFMPVAGDLERHLIINCYNPNAKDSSQFDDWRAVSDWARRLHIRPAQPTEELRLAVAKMTENLESPLEKLRVITAAVRDDIRYVAVEFGLGRFQPRSAGLTWSNRYGDCKDKVTLVRTMLRLVDINAEPVLALTEGRVDPDMPSPFQFNHVIVGIRLSDIPSFSETNPACKDGWLYMDPTSDATPLGRLPSALHGTTVLRMLRYEYELVELPSCVSDEHRRDYYASAVLDAEGTVTANVRITDLGDRAAEIAKYRHDTPQKEQLEYWYKLFSKSMQDPLVTQYSPGTCADSTWVTFVVSSPHYLNQAGEASMFKLDPFHADRRNKIKKNKERHYPIWIGDPLKVQTAVEWHLSPAVVVSDYPDSIIGTCNIADVSCRTEFKDSTLYFRSTLTLNGGEIPSQDYIKAVKFERAWNKVRGARVFVTR